MANGSLMKVESMAECSANVLPPQSGITNLEFAENPRLPQLI